MAGMTTTIPAPIRPIAVLAALCLFATACDAPATDPSATPAASEPTDLEGDPPAPDDSSPDEGEAAVSSPLSDFLHAGEDLDEGVFERQERDYGQAVVACMTAQGFEYTPPREHDGDDGDAGPWDLPQEEFVASYGYGVTTIDQEAAPAHEDPNQERIDAMSPAERRAYHRALFGELMPLDEDGYPDPRPVPAEPGTSNEDPDMGCSGEAGEQVWGNEEDAAEDFARFQGLIDDMVEIRERVDQDPRVVEAIQAWRDCMADAGHPFDAPDDPRDEIHDRLADLLGDVADEGADSSIDRDAPLPSSLEDVDPEALEQLRDHELELATVDRRCTIEHGVERIRNEVQVELEQDFIEQHRDELEAYRDLTAAGGGGVG